MFADYAVKNSAEYSSHADMLRCCVPYLIIAERLHGEKAKLEQQAKRVICHSQHLSADPGRA